MTRVAVYLPDGSPGPVNEVGAHAIRRVTFRRQ
ncbi:MAG: hypothetical protein JWR58_545 [Pseudonocardia sp.]|jgi:hypothetical protein|nr:hypothetical protein [Pseudonocardia sp.]